MVYYLFLGGAHKYIESNKIYVAACKLVFLDFIKAVHNTLV